MVTKQPGPLKQLVEHVLRAAGADERNAKIVADHLVGAELCGVQTHGILHIPMYLEQIEAGELIPTHWPALIVEHDNRAVVTGNLTFGHVGADHAVRCAIDKAQAHALALVGLVRANHIGRLGHYAEMAAAAGMIAMIWGSGYAQLEARAAAYGGRDRVLDTNPLAIGIPTGTLAPVVVDFATTHSSALKVHNARRRGQQLTEGVIVDRAGGPTTDPEDFFAGGALAPFGGHKGYAIMLATELLGRVLSGADSHVREGQGVPMMRHQGVTFLVVRADALGSRAEFQGRVDQTLARVTASRPAAGFDRVLYPGQKEAVTRAQWSRDGIPIADDVWEGFANAAHSVGVAV